MIDQEMIDSALENGENAEQVRKTRIVLNLCGRGTYYRIGAGRKVGRERYGAGIPAPDELKPRALISILRTFFKISLVSILQFY